MENIVARLDVLLHRVQRLRLEEDTQVLHTDVGWARIQHRKLHTFTP